MSEKLPPFYLRQPPHPSRENCCKAVTKAPDGLVRCPARAWLALLNFGLYALVTKAELVTSGLPHRIELLAVMEGTIE